MNAARMGSRVQQEVAIHAKLKHPAILQLYTFFEDMSYVYLVLELAHNGELHRYLKSNSRQLTELETANIISQVVNGLLYLHSHNIIHRDMSLSNLLLTQDFQVKIADFGLATLSGPNEKHMTMCGTPNYISPEVVSRASHGRPADVWGLGCMLYTLLVGKPPFDTDAIKSTLTKVVMSDYAVPSYLSYEAKDLLDQLLRKNPLERIRLEQVLSHPFMTKNPLPTTKYNNTLASADSGILMTMSSGASNNMTRQNMSRPMLRSRSEERYNPMPMQQHNTPENITPMGCAAGSFASLHEPMEQGYFSYTKTEYAIPQPNTFKRFGSIDLKNTHDSLFQPDTRTHFSDNTLEKQREYGRFDNRPFEGTSAQIGYLNQENVPVR